jgi:2-iminobutanoate/2-iminopropanoate deaminase
VAESIEDQTRQAMENLKSILEEAGSSLDRLLKVTIFLQDMGDFKRVNEAYGSFFSGDYPARCAYQVAKLPLDAHIEIDGIAAI